MHLLAPCPPCPAHIEQVTVPALKHVPQGRSSRDGTDGSQGGDAHGKRGNSARWPHLLAFDLLRLEGRDLRALPADGAQATARHHHAARGSHVRFVDAIDERGEDFFRVVCDHDLEGVVAKPKYGPYYVT